MRERVVFVLPLLLATFAMGCNKSPRDKLQGKWVGEDVQHVHPSQLARAQGWVKETRLELNGNNATVSIPAEEPRSGSFKVAKVEGNDMDVVFIRKAGAGEDRSKMSIAEDGKLHWTMDNGVVLVMHRE